MGSRVGFRNVVAVAWLLLAFAALALAGRGPAGVAEAQVTGAPGGLQATIRTTSHGIPHIVASDFPGLGFGYGYAAARANICVLADMYVTTNGERSRFFGPDGSYSQGGNGTTNNNLDSDFFYQRIKDNGTIQRLLALDAPRGPRPEIKQAVRGYVAGYNKWLAETGVDDITDPRCRGAEWVRPITEMDAYQRFYQLGLIASQGVAIDGIGGAQPPVGVGPDTADPRRGRRHDRAARRAAAARGDRLERLRARPRRDRQRPRHGARQPALPVGRLGALLRGAADDPRADQRERREPVRRAGDQHRPHRQPRVEPHGVDRVPLHAVRAEARARLADQLPVRRRGPPDEGRGRDRAGEERRGQPRAAHAHALLIAPRPDPHLDPRAAAVPLDPGDRLGDRRRQRRQLPLPEPLLRGQPGAGRRRARRGDQAQPGRAVGQHDRRRLRRRRLLRGHLRGPARHQRAGHDLQHRARQRHLPGTRAAGARRLAVDVRVGQRPRRRGAGHLRARRTCRSCAGTTTSSTPTTATGSPTPTSRWRASTASSATSAPSAPCASARAS